jgi:F-type H+-transporting ATPase subunit delta
MARAGTVARRYAEAAFEIALRDDTVDAWLEQLTRLGVQTTDPSVVRTLENPNVPIESRRQALIATLGPDALPQVGNLLGLVLRRRRVDALVDMAREFRRLYNRRAGIVEATATSALPLADAEVAALRSRLEQMTQGKVELDMQVDPQLLGGVQVRIGDLLIDGSVRGRLERLRGRLASGQLTP